MATPILQNTICKYETYAIIYGSNNGTTKIPMNPRYLTPLLKNDQKMIANYSGDVIESIGDYTYLSLSELHFTVSVEVVEKEVTAETFLNDYVMRKGNYNNLEDIKKLLSIASCSKALLLCVFYMLYYADESEYEDVINLSFLEDIDTMQPLDLYDYVLTTMESLCMIKNPIKIEDYVPTVEVEEMPLYYPAINNYCYLTELQSNTNRYKLATPKTSAYKNMLSLTGTGIRITEFKNEKISVGDWSKLWANDLKNNKFTIVEDKTKYDSDTKSYVPYKWKLTIGPHSSYWDDYDGDLIKISKGTVTNKTKNLTITFPKGFVITTKHWWNNIRSVFNSRNTYTLPEAVILNPGESWVMDTHGIAGTPVFQHSWLQNQEYTQHFYIETYNNVWYNEFIPDIDAGRIKNISYEKANSAPFLISCKVSDISSLKTMKQKLSLGDRYVELTANKAFIVIKDLHYSARGLKTISITKSKVVNYVVTKIVQVAYTVVRTIVKTIETLVKGLFSWLKNVFKKEETVTETHYKEVEEKETKSRIETWVESYDENMYHDFSMGTVVIWPSSHTLDSNYIDNIVRQHISSSGTTYLDRVNINVKANNEDYSTCTFTMPELEIYIVKCVDTSVGITTSNNIGPDSSALSCTSSLLFRAEDSTTDESEFNSGAKKIYINLTQKQIKTLIDLSWENSYTSTIHTATGVCEITGVSTDFWNEYANRTPNGLENAFKLAQESSLTGRKVTDWSYVWYTFLEEFVNLFSFTRGVRRVKKKSSTINYDFSDTSKSIDITRNKSFINSFSFKQTDTLIDSSESQGLEVDSMVLKCSVNTTGSTVSYVYSFDGSRNSDGVLSDRTFNITCSGLKYSPDKTIGLTNRYKLTFNLNTDNLYKELQEAAVEWAKMIKKTALDVGMAISEKSGAESVIENVLYKIKRVYVRPTFGIDLYQENGYNYVDSEVKSIPSDIEHILNYTDIEVVFPTYESSDSTVLVNKTVYNNSVNNAANGCVLTTVGASSDDYYRGSIVLTPAEDMLIMVDISDYELYYYNGSIYKK